MNPIHIALIFLGLALPIALFLWHERSQTNPASRWPSLAKVLQFAYSDNPPTLKGQWKERQVILQMAEGGALMRAAIRTAGAFRVEIGPKEAMEKASGMIVPDRIAIPDSALDEKLLLRATPGSAGESVDLTLLRKIAQFHGAWVIIVPGRAEMRFAFPPTEASQIREAADVLVSLADVLEGM
jgi:hypothetical protein